MDMHKKFDHGDMEKKWQESWRKSGIYNVGARDSLKEKRYVLTELPYPSGDLHIGHWFAFAVVDIYVRMLRMQGYQVLFPIGFDAFGLPAENAAIKRGLDPAQWTFSNMETMRTQLDSMGNAFSWDKSVNTTDSDYYLWTQWMFTQFFQNGLAYRGAGMVNWCPVCNTVLANEQVLANGTCERCGAHVEKREMNEWKLRITRYADRLIDDLDTLDWPEFIKESQKNWIGRSRGAQISFTIKDSSNPIEVFTTRPDTLYGATFIVLAPEHPLLASLNIENREEVMQYAEEALQKEEIERTNATKKKTGVMLEGVRAINPGNGAEIPVFVADYVLGGYGTGAIMGVPAHDERDLAFAETYNLPIISVIDENGILINSEGFNGKHAANSMEEIVASVRGHAVSTYRLRDWSIGRQRYWGVPIPIVYDPEGNAHIIPREHLPWTLPTDVDFRPTGEAPLAKSKELRERTERIFGKGWFPEVETMDTFVDSSWYYLRYLDGGNDDAPVSLQAQKDWMPVDMYLGGSEHNTMHLLYSRFWHKALFDMGLVTTNEPYLHRVNRGLVLGPDGQKMSKSKGNVINPDEHVTRVGSDTVKTYLAFMGNYSEPSNYPWDMGGIAGVRRFLERVNGLSEHIGDDEPKEMTKLLHKTIMKVTNDIAALKFNTAIAALMIFVNDAERKGLTKSSYEIFLKLIAPFAPHLAEELWYTQGHGSSIHTEKFPAHDESFTVDTMVTIGVQVAGKRRGDITIPPDMEEEEAVSRALENPVIAKYIPQGKPRTVVYVKGRILNLIP